MKTSYWFATTALLLCSAESLLECVNDDECQEQLLPGSICLPKGFCSNPYANGGCLSSRLPNWNKLRVCGSQDPPELIEQGYCRKSPLPYKEVRIMSQNWETAVFITWILQVLLSEMLDVPTSLETSFHDARTNYYDYESEIGWGWSNDLEALDNAAEHGDCVPLTQNFDGYKPCAHVIPEVWGSHRWAPPLVARDIIEPVGTIGELGHEGWYIPFHTAKHDPSLLHYTGLVGEENREKLAATFKQPITWLQYCDSISPTNCTEPDSVAARHPDEDSLDKYFVPVLYQGHFISTDRSNCTINPDCKGNFMDYPCGWSSYAAPIIHHLNIALEGNGPNGPPKAYRYSSLKEIWHAANATKNHVIMQYMKPEVLYHAYINTDFAFQRVTLPEPTQICSKSRRKDSDRCADDVTLEVRMGDIAGTCDEPPEALQKIISKALFQITKGPDIPDALQSPAFDAIKDFRISDLQIHDVFSHWDQQTTDPWNFGSRDAVCTWIVENMDFMEAFVPLTYPRVIQEEDVNAYENNAWLVIALCVSIIAVICTAGTAGFTFFQRKRGVIQRAKVEFLWLILGGLFLVSIGSLVAALPPTDATCISTIWLINFGYSLELTPLVAKTAGLNCVLSAGRKMRKVTLNINHLFRTVACIGFLVLVSLMIWTIIDPPQQQIDYKLAPNNPGDSETVVEQGFYCDSDSDAWWIISVSWQFFLLLVAAVLAFQNRTYREDLTDTRTLALMIYSHIVFVGLRVVLHLLEESISPSTLPPYRSLFYSIDAIVSQVIYFLPKFLSADPAPVRRGSSIFFSQETTVSGRTKFVQAPKRIGSSTKPGSSDMNISMESTSSYDDPGKACKSGPGLERPEEPPPSEERTSKPPSNDNLAGSGDNVYIDNLLVEWCRLCGKRKDE